MINVPLMDDRFTIKPRKDQSTVDGGSIGFDTKIKEHPLLFEMLRSFTTLARTLNLSHAVKELNSTRQTVRRHITQLEEMKQGQLFSIVNRQYMLSDLGRVILPEAEDLLSQASAWVSGAAKQVDGLQYLRLEEKDWFYYQQQQPISHAFSSTGDLLKACIEAWSVAGGEIEHDAMLAIRPKCMMFRRSEANWIFTEVGEDSSLTSWLGWKFARSTIGTNLGQMPGGEQFDRLVTSAYTDVERTQSLRLDHCFTVLQNGEIGEPLPIAFERLLLGSRFADGSFAIVSAVRRTYDVEIKGVTHEMLRLMPEKFLM
jgi:hypothetical protein